ncbi:MAG: ATP-binding cassette domain-containing protein [Pirellulales bacterium]
MSSPPPIEIVDLVHRYGERTALDHLSLTVNTGEFLAVLGPNGGGKTTLFRILSTLIPPQAGRVAIYGRDSARETSEVRRELGVVFQAPSLDKKLSVGENLSCQGRLYGLTQREIRERGGELLERLGIADRIADRAETLSGGLKRRVEICKSLLHGPRLLLLDEPSTGLDPLARHELWKYLHALSRARRRDGRGYDAFFGRSRKRGPHRHPAWRETGGLGYARRFARDDRWRIADITNA